MSISSRRWILSVALGLIVACTLFFGSHRASAQGKSNDTAADDAMAMFNAGRQTFRFDTFGDEDYWGGQLKLHQAIEGTKLGGVGNGVSPKAAMALGIKVDVDALPDDLVSKLKAGQVDLTDPASTIALLKQKALVGLTGIFDSTGNLTSIGIQCALCHSTVDDSFAPNIGHRRDGWANRDLNPGAIILLAPDLSPVIKALNSDQPSVTQALNGWGPGRFDAEFILDGQSVNPNTGKTAAVLIPPAFGLAGVNLHTWTGWGGVPHWNAFVATLEMHGKGRFFDPRLNQFTLAFNKGYANLNQNLDPDSDLITGKLAALQFYQLALKSPKPPDGSFDKDASDRGDKLFSGKAQCNNCHVEPLWTEPGWNLHPAKDVCVDSFQANRAPDKAYRTSPLGGLFSHQKGGFYHDGRFATLMDVVDHYDRCLGLGLAPNEKNDLIQYLLSL